MTDRAAPPGSRGRGGGTAGGKRRLPGLDPRVAGRFLAVGGPLAPGSELERLTELTRRLGALPYENLTKLLAARGLDGAGTPVARVPGERGPLLRRPEVVVREHLALGAGGTCFSLTELLRQLCRHLGLECHPVMAHMRHGPHIHCALVVEAGGRSYLVDPGYLIRRPIALDGGSTRSTPAAFGAPFVVRAGSRVGPPPHIPPGALDLFTMEGDGPRWRYRLGGAPPTPEQFVGHWLRSFSGSAMRTLLVSRRGDDGELLFLHGHKLRRQWSAGRENCNVRGELEQAVAGAFQIDPLLTARARRLVHEGRGQRGGG